jgi:hypothetical protein
MEQSEIRAEFRCTRPRITLRSIRATLALPTVIATRGAPTRYRRKQKRINIALALAARYRTPCKKPMRILSFSDIHGNLSAVQALRAAEDNSFDAVIVAGDIGNAAANDFISIVSTFACPILYVYGNWDHKLSYRKAFGTNCHLAHLRILKIGDLAITGFSGCPTNWGRNPIAEALRRKVVAANRKIAEAYADAEAWLTEQVEVIGLERARKPYERVISTRAYQRYRDQLQAASAEALEINRRRLKMILQRGKRDPRKTIVVTHERLYHLTDISPPPLLHLFGHKHGFAQHIFKGTQFVNVSALDVANSPLSSKRAVGGTYTVIEIDLHWRARIECRRI